jgi:hypothetical protein
MTDTELKIRPESAKTAIEQVKELLEEGEIGAVLTMHLVNKDGNIVPGSERAQKSESFVRGFLDMLNSMMYGANGLSAGFAQDLWGGYTSITQQYQNMSAMGAVGAYSWGIAVGTGTIAPTISDVSLQTIIAHGSGAGQLNFSAMTYGAPTSDVTRSQFYLTRDFSNASGGSITVNEAGLFLYNNPLNGTPPSTEVILAIRDVIAGGYAVPNGQTLVLNYMIICNI